MPEKALQNIPNQPPHVQRNNTPPRSTAVTNTIVHPLPINNLPIIHTIFGGDKFECMPSQRRACCKEYYRDSIEMQVNLTEATQSHPETI